MRAFILAAGLGTRLKPLTDKNPKALVEINGVPLIEIVVTRLINAGFNDIIINVHHFAEKVIAFLRSKNFFDIQITISDESSKLLDTGGGLKKASWFLKKTNPFLVHNVDIVSGINIKQLCDSQKNSTKIATLAVQERESSRYFLFDEEKNLCGWKNDKTGEVKMARKPVGKLKNFAFSGIHAANPAIFDFLPEENVFSLVDFFLKTAADSQITYFNHSGSEFLDLGKKENLAEAAKFVKHF